MPRLRLAAAFCAAAALADEVTVKEEAKELASVWNPAKCSATLFGGELDDPRFWHVTFPVGAYNLKEFERKGARNDQTTSIRVKGPGCEATVFGGDLDDRDWQHTFKEGEYNLLDQQWVRQGVVTKGPEGISALRVQSPDQCSVTVYGGALDEKKHWAIHLKDGEYTKGKFEEMGVKPSEVASLRVFGYGCVAQVWASELDDPAFWCQSFPEGEYDRGEFWRKGGVEEVVSAMRIHHAPAIDNSRCVATGEEILASRRRRESVNSLFSYFMWSCGFALVGMFVCKKMNNPNWSPMDLEHELDIGRSSGDGLVASVGGALGMRTVQRPDDGYWLG